MKQDHLIPKGYAATSDNTHLWARLGAVDGLKYLTRHFQIVIHSRDVLHEDFGVDQV